MASSESLATLEPWTFRSTFPDSWISQMFAGENETLTKALQKSLSNQPETIAPERPATGTVMEVEAAGSKRRDTIHLVTKRTKRKSRASKRTTTTFIAADPANFRQMVQQVTGVRFGNGQMPVVPVLKPEPQRPVNRMQGWLPTLDTSIPLLDRQQQVVGPMEPTLNIPPPSVVADGGAGLNLDSFSGFPTLESWKVL
ncbi:calmodulin-binding protein 25 [Cornus florida]|uniref:calmodulin-binding protein 25 n=1 Tax=Cornus florida TaxID=4283 RepID=UPI00289BCE3A|nr:calmodulin-binding protein 25 [Cornus florida]